MILDVRMKISQIVRPFYIIGFNRIFSFLKGKKITKKLTKIDYIFPSRLQRLNVIIMIYNIYIYIFFFLQLSNEKIIEASKRDRGTNSEE